MTDRPRQPEGTPIGGQWAAKGHAEADVELDVAPAEPVLPGDLIDYLSQFTDGEEVTLHEIELYFAERNGQAAASAPADTAGGDGDLERHVDLGDGRSVNVKVTDEGLIVDVFVNDDLAATSSQMFDELADAVEESDPSFERAVTQLQAAQRAVLGASTVEIAKAVREAAPNAAVIVAVADDEYPGVVYLSEVRDAAGETIGERFDDAWVSKLDDDLREHLGNASVYGDYDLTGGEQLTLDVRDLIWSA